MELTEHRYSVLLVSASEKWSQLMETMLPEFSFSPITSVADAGSARRRLLERQTDVVIINTPLPDEFGTRLALDACADSSAGVLLMVKAEHYPDISSKVMPYGVLTLSKPTSAQMLTQSLQLLCGTRERLRRMEQKTASIQEKMEEARIINRAKCLLIEQLKMTEAQAHRYIEKQAMDRCVTRRAIAENLISTYK